MANEALISQGNNKAPRFAGPVSVFQGRLQRDSATQISLQRYTGDTVEVNGEAVSIGSSGLTRAVSDNRIAADGTDAGAALAVSTLYYVYIANSQASFSPSSIRCSLQVPTLFNGVKYLATTGNGVNWRFVGWVRTDATGANGNFVDNATDRLVVNYYNRREANILLTPGYVDDNALTSYNFAPSGGLAKIKGGTGDTGSYIANGEDNVEITAVSSLASQAGVSTYIGIGDNSATTAVAACWARGTNDQSISCSYDSVPAEGYRQVFLLASNTGAGNSTIYADAARLGGSKDPYLTYLTATVMI